MTTRLEYMTRIEIGDPPAGELTKAEQARLLAAMNQTIEAMIEATIFAGYSRAPARHGEVRLVRSSLGVINLNAVHP